jgi:hypothetical protein
MKKIIAALAIGFGFAAVSSAADVPTTAMPAEVKLETMPKNDKGAYVLFNGKDLTGWDGDPRFWTVEDGAIKGFTLKDQPLSGNTFLISTVDVPQDYELSVTWKMANGNSGVQFRSKRLKPNKDNKWTVGGYQADIADNQFLGILYEEQGPRAIAAQVGEKVTLLGGPDPKKKEVEKFADPKEIKAGVNHKEWNTTVITVKGNHIVQTLNGKKTIEVIDNNEQHRAMDGIIALQIHTGPPMQIWFKDITIRPIEGK